MAPGPDAGAPGRAGGFPFALLVGAGVNGLAAVAAIWIAQHHLGLERFAPLAQIWTLWSLVAAALVFGFQQWSITRSRRLAPAEQAVVPARVLGAIGALSLAGGVVAAAAAAPLFDTTDVAWPLAVATLAGGTAITGLSYGVLAHGGRISQLALVMATENVVRLAVVVLLVLLDSDPRLFALVVPAGFVVAAVPFVATRRHAVAVGPTGGTGEPASGTTRSTAGPTGTTASVAGTAAVGLVSSLVIFGAPLLLGLAGGAPTVVSTLFVVLIPVRVPFLFVMALMPALAVHANRLVATGETGLLRRTTTRLVVGGIALAAVTAPLAAFAGDPLGDRIFGIGGLLPRPAYALLGAAAALGLAATATNVMLLAAARQRMLYLGWAAAVLAAAVLVVTGGLADPVALTAWMLAANAGVLVLHAVVIRGATTASGH